jgi:hypothetical protein
MNKMANFIKYKYFAYSGFISFLAMNSINGNPPASIRHLTIELKKIFPSLQLKIKKTEEKTLAWKIVPNPGDGFLIFYTNDENKKKRNITNLFIVFPRKGSFFQIYNPEIQTPRPKSAEQKLEIKNKIRVLTDKLKTDDFPSAKHRYGAEIELAALRKSLTPTIFSPKLLGFTTEWIIFSAQDLSMEMENNLGKLPDGFFININNYHKGKDFAIGNFSEGMAHGMIYPTGILKIQSLPYAFYRKESGQIFNKFPQVKTLVLFSIDAHSMGPSGIQIENR